MEVAQLRFRPKPLSEAVASFMDARLTDCLRDLHGNVSAEAEILRARTALRLNRAEAAATGLADLTLESCGSQRHFGEALILKAAALSRLLAFTAAEDAFSAAWVHVVSAGDVAMEAEYEYYRGLHAWLQGRFQGAAAILRALEAFTPPDEAWLRPVGSYIVPLAATQARALELLGFEAARNGRVHEQLDLLRRGVALLQRGEVRDRFIEAGLLRNMAVAARELDAVDDAVAIEKHVAGFGWVPDLGEQRYHIVRSLGWSRALAGDHVGALRRFREAGKLAVNPAWHLIAVLDRAYLAVELDQTICAEEEVAHAMELSRAIDWSKVVGEEAFALLMLAQLVAKSDAAEAIRLLECYSKARRYATSLAFAPLDPRIRATECYARAQIALAQGSKAAATVMLLDAFKSFHQTGSKWRAALCACDLADLGLDDRYARYADREAARRPLSWLARRRSAAAVAR